MRIEDETDDNDLDVGEVILLKRVDLDGIYYIDIDKFNFTLCHDHLIIKKNGEQVVGKQVCGYFSSLESLFRHLLKIKTKDKIIGVISLANLRDIILETQEEIHLMCTKLNI